jgi:hypothetical protein
MGSLINNNNRKTYNTVRSKLMFSCKFKNDLFVKIIEKFHFKSGSQFAVSVVMK